MRHSRHTTGPAPPNTLSHRGSKPVREQEWITRGRIDRKPSLAKLCLRHRRRTPDRQGGVLPRPRRDERSEDRPIAGSVPPGQRDSQSNSPPDQEIREIPLGHAETPHATQPAIALIRCRHRGLDINQPDPDIAGAATTIPQAVPQRRSIRGPKDSPQSTYNNRNRARPAFRLFPKWSQIFWELPQYRRRATQPQANERKTKATPPPGGGPGDHNRPMQSGTWLP